MRAADKRLLFGPLLSLASMSPGVAAAPPGTVGPDQNWILRAGGEAGQDQSRASAVSLDYKAIANATTPDDPQATWSGGISGLHTDAPTQSGGTVTTNGAVYARFGTDAISGGLAFDSTADDGFRRSPRWTATLDLGRGGFTSELSVSTRRTTFDDFAALVPESGRRFGGTVLVNANASCSVRDTGYALNVGYSGGGWSGYVTGAGSRFDGINCTYGLAGTGLPSRFDRSSFQQLAGPFINQAAARAGGQIGQSTRLLQATLGGGLSRQWERAAIAFDYTHTQDELGGAPQDAYVLTGSAKLTARIAAQLSLGTTAADSKSTPYVGVYLAVGW